MLNGQIPPDLLVPIPGTSFELRQGAAAAWAAVCVGVEHAYGWTPTLNDAYRDLARQVAMLEANYDHTYRPGMTEANGGLRSWGGSTWYRKPGRATAAVPGTSNHGWGIAVDVDNLGAAHSTRWAQFATVAQPLGWTWSAALGEPWHWDYPGPADTVSNAVSQILGALPVAPAAPDFTPPIPEDAMTDRIIRDASTGAIALASGDGTFVPLANRNEVDSFRLFGLVEDGPGAWNTWESPNPGAYNAVAAVAARKVAQQSSDPAAVAQHVAAILVPAVVAALPTDSLTPAQVEQAAEQAIKTVLGGLG